MPTHVYVDGFNLYYGALKGTPYKWLDLTALCRRLLPKDDITLVRYFTARVSARPNDRGLDARQDAYLRAVEADPPIQIHLGQFRTGTKRMPRAPLPTCGRPSIVEVVATEEKGSDVNLASYLLLDAFRARCDTAELQGTFFKQLRAGALRDSQLPRVVVRDDGPAIKPKTW